VLVTKAIYSCNAALNRAGFPMMTKQPAQVHWVDLINIPSLPPSLLTGSHVSRWVHGVKSRVLPLSLR
jgi:hypothetical protein